MGHDEAGAGELLIQCVEGVLEEPLLLEEWATDELDQFAGVDELTISLDQCFKQTVFQTGQ